APVRAFTLPGCSEPGCGAVYSEKAGRRAWHGRVNVLPDLFAGSPGRAAPPRRSPPHSAKDPAHRGALPGRRPLRTLYAHRAVRNGYVTAPLPSMVARFHALQGQTFRWRHTRD